MIRFLKFIMSKIHSLAVAMAAMFIGTEKNAPAEKHYDYIKPAPDYHFPISTAKTDHLSIAAAGKFNKRNNQLFKMRRKAASNKY